MTLADISRIKRVEAELRQAKAYAEGIIQTLPEPVLDIDLRSQSALRHRRVLPALRRPAGRDARPQRLRPRQWTVGHPVASRVAGERTPPQQFVRRLRGGFECVRGPRPPHHAHQWPPARGPTADSPRHQRRHRPATGRGSAQEKRGATRGGAADGPYRELGVGPQNRRPALVARALCHLRARPKDVRSHDQQRQGAVHPDHRNLREARIPQTSSPQTALPQSSISASSPTDRLTSSGARRKSPSSTKTEDPGW